MCFGIHSLFLLQFCGTGKPLQSESLVQQCKPDVVEQGQQISNAPVAARAIAAAETHHHCSPMQRWSVFHLGLTGVLELNSAVLLRRSDPSLICFVKACSFPDTSKKGFSLANLWILCYLQVTLKWTRFGWCGFSTNPQSWLFPEYFLLIKALKLKSWILFPALPLSPLSSACCPQATAECSFLAAAQRT